MKGMNKTTLVNAIFGAAITMLASAVDAQNALDAPEFNDEDELLFPANTDMWIHMGSSLGSEYGDEPFDPENPGIIGVVQMEPSAYQYFLENNEYADGTMFLLSFYSSEAESSPQLPGFVQGELEAKEIHLIDKAKYSEGRGFFLYRNNDMPGSASAKIPDGSACFVCHMAEGNYDGTFTQFYPIIRDKVPAN